LFPATPTHDLFHIQLELQLELIHLQEAPELIATLLGLTEAELTLAAAAARISMRNSQRRRKRDMDSMQRAMSTGDGSVSVGVLASGKAEKKDTFTVEDTMKEFGKLSVAYQRKVTCTNTHAHTDTRIRTDTQT
jgi:hypothetical protein